MKRLGANRNGLRAPYLAESVEPEGVPVALLPFDERLWAILRAMISRWKLIQPRSSRDTYLVASLNCDSKNLASGPSTFRRGSKRGRITRRLTRYTIPRSKTRVMASARTRRSVQMGCISESMMRGDSKGPHSKARCAHKRGGSDALLPVLDTRLTFPKWRLLQDASVMMADCRPNSSSSPSEPKPYTRSVQIT